MSIVSPRAVVVYPIWAMFPIWYVHQRERAAWVGVLALYVLQPRAKRVDFFYGERSEHIMLLRAKRANYGER